MRQDNLSVKIKKVLLSPYELPDCCFSVHGILWCDMFVLWYSYVVTNKIIVENNSVTCLSECYCWDRYQDDTVKCFEENPYSSVVCNFISNLQIPNVPWFPL